MCTGVYIYSGVYIHIFSLADLALLSGGGGARRRRPRAFVGTAASWWSRLALYVLVGEVGLVPLTFIDKPAAQLWTGAGVECARSLDARIT